MANGEDDASDAAANAVPRRRRRPTPTIDLTATEVASKPEEKPAASARDSVTSPAPPREGSAPAADAPAAEKPESEPPKAAPRAKWTAWPPGGIPWPPSRSLLGAGAAGGGVVLLLFALLWLAGLFSTREDGSAALNARLARVETRLREIPNGATAAAADPKKLDDLLSRLGKLEAAAAAPAASEPAIANRLTGIEAAVKALQGKLADLDKRADAALLAVDAARSTPAERTELDTLTKRIAALEQTTKGFSDDLAKRAAVAGDRPVRLAVSAQALRAAVERGDPFSAELAAVKPLAADPQALAPLEPFAASGVPTQAALARQLSDVVPAMQRLVGATPPDAGVLDRFRASAERLVRIRPIDEVPGDDPTTIIGRIEAKAARSDIAGALVELATLPAPLRAPAEEWIKQAERRNAAVDASRRFASNALAALGKPSP
jgi:hypothetical protein